MLFYEFNIKRVTGSFSIVYEYHYNLQLNSVTSVFKSK